MNIITFKQMYTNTNNKSGVKMISIIEKLTYHFKISINKAIGFLLQVTTYKPDIKILKRIGEIYTPDTNINEYLFNNLRIAVKSNFRTIVKESTVMQIETKQSIEELSNILADNDTKVLETENTNIEQIKNKNAKKKKVKTEEIF